MINAHRIYLCILVNKVLVLVERMLCGHYFLSGYFKLYLMERFC